MAGPRRAGTRPAAPPGAFAQPAGIAAAPEAPDDGSPAQGADSHGGTSAPTSVVSATSMGESGMAGQAVDTRIGSHALGKPLAAGSSPRACARKDAATSGSKPAGTSGSKPAGPSGSAAAASGSKLARAPAEGSAAASGGKSGHEEASSDGDASPSLPLAIPSATRSSAARMIEASGLSAACDTEPMRAPASAAAEPTVCRASDSGTDGVLVSERQRSSHSSVVPPQPLTNAESTGRSGSAGPTSAALMES
jgi:hypothetical protein